MKYSARKKQAATTQRFTEIEDIVGDVVMLSAGQACLVIEVVATNFTLQSEEEQQVKILSYASLLNSLSFSIQILIISRKLDISSYIKLLENEATKTQNQNLAGQINQYKAFVADLVKANTVLDKKFYIVLSFSFLESGAGAVNQVRNKQAVAQDAKNTLHGKAQSVIQELLRIGLKSKILQKNELIELFYEIYNSDPAANAEHNVNTTFAGGGQAKL